MWREARSPSLRIPRLRLNQSSPSRSQSTTQCPSQALPCPSLPHTYYPSAYCWSPEIEEGQGVLSQISPEAKTHLEGLGGAWNGVGSFRKWPRRPAAPLLSSLSRGGPALPGSGQAVWYLQALRSAGPHASPVSSWLKGLYIAWVSIALSWTLTSGRT